METTAEPLLNINESPQGIAKPHKRPFITPENAKRLQLLGRDARLRKAAQQAALIAKAEADTELLKPLMSKAIALTVVSSPTAEQEYRLERLKRTREQLAKLDTWFDEAEDWKAAKAICEAIARLAVIEANLAGRPGPGNRQPSKERVAPASTTAEPL